MRADSTWKRLQIGAVATAGLMPDLVFVLDIAPKTAAGRIERALDRMESQGDEFQTQLRQGFSGRSCQRPETDRRDRCGSPDRCRASRYSSAADGYWVIPDQQARTLQTGHIGTLAIQYRQPRLGTRAGLQLEAYDGIGG